MYHFKTEQPDDIWEVENLLDLSFAPGREALSSYRLRDDVPPVGELCVVARDVDGVLAGAIRFWPVHVGEEEAPCVLLGPVAVHPTRQGEGLGGELILQGLDRARTLGWNRCILVGDAPYYSRFGFTKAEYLEFPPPTNPDRVLAISLADGAFDGVSGLVHKVPT